MIHILTLCTGNVCRSPLSAQLFTDRLDPKFFRAESAGLSPLTGDRMPTEMHRIVARFGLEDATAHRARALTIETLTNSDLIIGMSRHHRSAAVLLHLPAVRQAFTLLELAHIVSHIEEQDVRAVVQRHTDVEFAVLETVVRMRGMVPRLSPARRYDVEDPYGRSHQAFERSAQQIYDAVDQIAAFFHRVFATHQRKLQERS
ncbi:arsenate reductase/protein-tyrosine-phosphatase family protein [Enteractinococcus coprophilus]|uniref:Protein-tyrosine phosphatase n=1 Tax=Enteractinococcus coprophilus TaxID=1027633 RepID=A0A543AMS6_9MICC|nr:hypothetical protein [Enteractinococcus coprophilus]TQL73855.1 protein-tyrosine phosphatase [Enteractinococcus coprophilus]